MQSLEQAPRHHLVSERPADRELHPHRAAGEGQSDVLHALARELAMDPNAPLVQPGR
jgi:hypothetical protein